MQNRKRIKMDDIMQSLENDCGPSDLEKNTMKLNELIKHIEILNQNIVKLIEIIPREGDKQISYIS